MKQIMPEEQGVRKGLNGCSWSEYFGPKNFEVGKTYRIVSVKYKKEKEIEYREGIVTRNDVIQNNGARALEMIVEERWRRSRRNVRRMYSYYKMVEVWELN
jgi:hypothetical protein